MDARKLFGVIIIVFGILLLLNSAGIADVNIGYLFSNFWPMILIIIGTFMLLANPASKVGYSQNHCHKADGRYLIDQTRYTPLDM